MVVVVAAPSFREEIWIGGVGDQLESEGIMELH